jgi:hypothetical protein
MKTKTEIKNKIKQLRHDRDLKPDNLSNYHFYKECMNAEINALQWALGYKSTRRYWCTGCGISYEYLQCPKCGDHTYLGNHDDKT